MGGTAFQRTGDLGDEGVRGDMLAALDFAMCDRSMPAMWASVWTYPVPTDSYRLESQAGLGASMSTDAGFSTGGVAHATQTPTVGNPRLPGTVF